MPGLCRVLPLVVVALGGCDGCSLSAPAGADAMPPIDAASGGDVSPACAPRPSYVPAGWVSYDGYAPCAGFYVPSDTSQLPPPVAWQDCEPTSGAAGCRRIQVDWPQPQGAIFIDADAAIDPNGRVVVTTSREYADHKFALVADADGPVYSALLATQLPRFRPRVYLTPAFSPPRWMLLVQENQTWTTGGCVFGTTDRVAPTGSLRWSGDRATVVGDLGVLEYANSITTSAALLDFDSGNHVADINSSLPMSFEWMFGDNVFWQGNSGRVATVGRWRPDAGATDFINYGFDPNHAAGSLGTDGHDMVWVEAQGNPTDASLWTTASYLTSPYVTDKSQLLPRRLRSASTQALGFTRIAVGCGYAVATFAEQAVVIRISDGWGWFLTGWAWQAPLAVTCNEAFFRVGIPGPLITIARVALSQLGAGVAPD